MRRRHQVLCDISHTLSYAYGGMIFETIWEGISLEKVKFLEK